MGNSIYYSSKTGKGLLTNLVEHGNNSRGNSGKGGTGTKVKRGSE